MSNKVNDIRIKLHDEIINIKILDSNNIKIDEKSQKNILIYYVECVTIKDSKYVKINSVNCLSLFFSKMNGTLKELMKISIRGQFLLRKIKK